MLTAYVVIPSILVLYSKYFYQICPILICLRPLTKCVKNQECKQILECLSDCENPKSSRRSHSFQKFGHLQNPSNPAYCRYQCLDELQDDSMDDFLNCIGSSPCLEPANFSDTCVTPPTALPFEHVEKFIVGSWQKIFTTGWDLWPCQTTWFHAPLPVIAEALSNRIDDNHLPFSPPPESWMTQWPHTPNVYRMDLFWKTKSNHTFHMSNEMYINSTWKFAANISATGDRHRDFANVQDSDPILTRATLRTRAIMWGTEAHENWYLLDYDVTSNYAVLIIYYCAYTIPLRAFDSMAMVLYKSLSTTSSATTKTIPSEKNIQEIHQRACQVLGNQYGKLQRIPDCPFQPFPSDPFSRA